MQIAVTADCHLTTRSQHPERYAAFEAVLQKTLDLNLNQLIIAGDLFDENVSDIADFETLVKRRAYQGIHLHVIPGNHDHRLNSRMLDVSNVTVYDHPQVKAFDLMSLPCFFLPYAENSSMGGAIGQAVPELPADQWILISHGDWIEGLREPNPYEPGVYMPLARSDMDQFSPRTVLLGHIHKPQILGRVHYPGSPFPLHINETGRRRLLVLDTETGRVQSEPLFTHRLYYQATITVLPMADEHLFIQSQIDQVLKQWDLTGPEREIAVIRIRAEGYTADRAAVAAQLREAFKGYTFETEAGPDLSSLKINENRDLAEISRQIFDEIESLAWPAGGEEPSRQEILIEALKVIYEE